MSLDQNLFTLFFTPNPSHAAGTVVDLVDGSGTTHYRKRRILSQQQLYRIEVSDPLSDALLASATAPSATSKHKTLELYNPTKIVELKYTGTLTFRWSFKWEIHEFEWKREECFIIRKPDPPVLVAVTKEPPGRIRTTAVQILDYNLNRFDIEDRKGLEIVILTALMTFRDASDVYHESNATAPASASTSAIATTTTTVSGTLSTVAPPQQPPKPAPKKGTERIAELQLGRGQVNEVTVLEEGSIADYAKHCARLLHDNAMLFITVLSSESNQVSKVLQVVEETKRLRYKAGEPDLHQYVLYDTREKTAPQKGPRIINLDDHDRRGKSNKEYTPPKSLAVHLSKIDMPELQPRGTSSDRAKAPARHERDSGRKREDGRSTRAFSSPGQGTTSGRPSLLHKHRSQFFPPSTSSTFPPSGTDSSPFPHASTAHHPPPLPPRMPSSGTSRRRSLNDGHYDYPHGHDYGRDYGFGNGHDGQQTQSPVSSGPSASGLLGRFLGR